MSNPSKGGRDTGMCELARQYDFENWSGKSVTDIDTARIEVAIYGAIADSKIEVFQRDLTTGCASVGWKHDHPMILWTVAIYANIFPVCEMPREVRRYDGPIHFAGPSIALKQSKFKLFWNDRDLVCLALKRTKTPDYPVGPAGQRSGLRPYQGW